MKQRRTHPLLAIAVVAALLLGACSSGGDDDANDTTSTTEATTGDGEETTTTDGDDEGDETTTTAGGDEGGVDVGADGQAYVDAMMQSMTADEDEIFLSDDQAECFASRFVDVIGVDRLAAAGITPEMMADESDALEFVELELSEDEGNDIYDNFGRCGVNLREAMLQSMAADEDMTPEMRTCMEGVFTDESLRTFMVIGMTKGEDAIETDPAASALMAGLMGCAFMGMGSGDFGFDTEDITGDLGEG